MVYERRKDFFWKRNEFASDVAEHVTVVIEFREPKRKEPVFS